MFDKREQYALRIVQAAHAVDRAHHVFRIDDQVFHDVREAMKGKIEMDRCIRPDATLDGRVRDITFVPKGDVLECRGDRRADKTGEARQVFSQDRVALVGHGRRAFLTGGEELLRFQHFRALEVAHFRGEAFDGGGNYAEGREIHRVAVARDDLRRDRLDGEAELGGNVRFDLRVDIGECADSAGDGTGRDFLAGEFHTGAGALELGIEGRELHAKCGWFGMDTVAAADRGGELVLAGACFESLQDAVEAAKQEVCCPHHLDVEAGIEHV